MSARDIFEQSNGDVTRAYYTELQQRGSIGLVAMNLFRAQKTSTRAKLYRGRRYKSAAYDVKSYSMSELCKVLEAHGDALQIRYGWKEDPTVPFGEQASWVLYVDLPEGQVSFHSPNRGIGPLYSGEWDGIRASEVRILAFADRVMEMTENSYEPVARQVHPPPLRFGDPASIAMKRRRRAAT